MPNEKLNKQCALEFNNLLFELSEKGLPDNAIANGMLFALSIHILNANYCEKELMKKFLELYRDIKKELEIPGRSTKIQIMDQKPINDQWD
jgi:hypothetical protein